LKLFASGIFWKWGFDCNFLKTAFYCEWFLNANIKILKTAFYFVIFKCKNYHALKCYIYKCSWKSIFKTVCSAQDYITNFVWKIYVRKKFIWKILTKPYSFFFCVLKI
jgi:hypothetical protein